MNPAPPVTRRASRAVATRASLRRPSGQSRSASAISGSRGARRVRPPQLALRGLGPAAGAQ